MEEGTPLLEDALFMVRETPYDPDAWEYLADALITEGRVEESLAALAKAQRLRDEAREIFRRAPPPLSPSDEEQADRKILPLSPKVHNWRDPPLATPPLPGAHPASPPLATPATPQARHGSPVFQESQQALEESSKSLSE